MSGIKELTKEEIRANIQQAAEYSKSLHPDKPGGDPVANLSRPLGQATSADLRKYIQESADRAKKEQNRPDPLKRNV